MTQPRQGLLKCPIPAWVAFTVGCLLRVVFLATRPLNVDEGWTMLVALSDLSLMDVTTFDNSVDPHPLLFYGLYRHLSPWITSADWLFRVPACLFSVVSVFTFHQFLKSTNLEESVKHWSLVLFAVLPANVHYAYDARAYSMAQLAAILVLLFYVRHGQCESWKGLIRLAIAVGFSCTFDVIGWVVVAAILICQLFVARPQRNWRSILATLSGIVLSLGYYGLRFVQFSGVGSSDQTQQSFSPRVLLDGLMQLTPFGIGESHARGLPGGSFIYAVLSFLTLLILLRALRETIRTKSSSYLLIWLVVLLPFVGQIGLAIFDGGFRLHRRYLMVLVPALVPVFTCGALMLLSDLTSFTPFGSDESKYKASTFFGFCILCVIPGVVSVGMQKRIGNRSDWRSLYDQIQQELRPTDGFVHPYASPAPGFVVGPLLAYAHFEGVQINPEAIANPRVSRSNEKRHVALDDLRSWATPEDLRAIAAFAQAHDGRRIWSFSTPVTRDRYIDLSQQGRLVGLWKAHNVEARLYTID